MKRIEIDRRGWWVIFAVLAIGLFVVAVRPDIYELTSPTWLTYHVLLRKIYSIVAFGTVGFAFHRASGVSPAWCALTVGAYSAAIEVGQFLDGSKEGLIWNAIDTGCGAIGGVLGAWCADRVRWF